MARKLTLALRNHRGPWSKILSNKIFPSQDDIMSLAWTMLPRAFASFRQRDEFLPKGSYD